MVWNAVSWSGALLDPSSTSPASIWPSGVVLVRVCAPITGSTVELPRLYSIIASLPAIEGEMAAFQ